MIVKALAIMVMLVNIRSFLKKIFPWENWPIIFLGQFSHGKISNWSDWSKISCRPYLLHFYVIFDVFNKTKNIEKCWKWPMGKYAFFFPMGSYMGWLSHGKIVFPWENPFSHGKVPFSHGKTFTKISIFS